jgi:SnoaL-like domain
MTPDEVVRQFFKLMNDGRWKDAGLLLAADVHVEYTSTRESFDGDRFMAMNAEYPNANDLDICVHETLSSGSRVAAQVTVKFAGETFWCAGFYTVINEKITDGVEHWVTEGSEEPPPWRSKYTSN